MFEYLDKHPIEQVTSAVYYAVRTLRHLKNIEVETLESEKYIKDKDLGISIISSIIDNEGKLLSDFDPKTKDKYITQLYNYLNKRNQSNSKSDKNLDIDFLKEWRNESVHHYDTKEYNFNYSKKVFISYNERDNSVYELKRILSLAKIEFIDWEDINPNISSLNFIESISSVSFAVFIINKQENKINSNQLFELGYLFGKLGRDKILVLLDSPAQMPSDLGGITSIKKDTQNWKFEFIKRLDFSGISFDKKVLDNL